LRHIVFWLPAPVALAGAGFACGWAVLQIGRSLLAHRWPAVDGEIIDARVVRDNQRQYEDAGTQVVTYRYQVDGQRYTNNRMRFGEPAPRSMVPVRRANANVMVPVRRGNANVVAAMASGHQARGKPIRVYYNPRDPEDSVVHRTAHFSMWLLLAVGLYFGYDAVHRMLLR